MKKFSKINENNVSGDIKIPFEFTIKEETANEIIEAILRVYPHERVLELYGYEKAIEKYVNMILNHVYSLNIHDLNDKISEWVDIDNDEIEELFLDDLSVDPEDVGDVLKKINSENIK